MIDYTMTLRLRIFAAAILFSLIQLFLPAVAFCEDSTPPAVSTFSSTGQSTDTTKVTDLVVQPVSAPALSASPASGQSSDTLKGMDLLVHPEGAMYEGCSPPSFYTSLPRDAEWYYGTAKDPDTEKARLHAIRNLGIQVTGDLYDWPESDIARIAGPGHDRGDVAIEVGKLLGSAPLVVENLKA